MIDITIEYPFLLFKRKAIGRAPSAWTELTEKQFIAISKVIHGGCQPDYKFLSILTGIKKELLKKLSPFQLLEISEEINFIGRAGGCHSDFIISELPGFGHRYQAPSHKMAGVTFAQFIFADSYYNDWAQLRQESALNKFIASMYLQAHEKFNNEMIAARVEAIDRIDIDIRMAIAFNFSLIIIWLQKAYPLVFKESEEIAEEPGTEKKQVTSVWVSIFEHMVGDDLINRDKYADLPIHTVLRNLTKKYKENARR